MRPLFLSQINREENPMKKLILLIFVLLFGCSDTLTEPIVNEQILSAIYTLPYDQQIDHDAQFISENFINTSGEIKEVIFYL